MFVGNTRGPGPYSRELFVNIIVCTIVIHGTPIVPGLSDRLREHKPAGRPISFLTTEIETSSIGHNARPQGCAVSPGAPGPAAGQGAADLQSPREAQERRHHRQGSQGEEERALQV